jgi:phosphatidylserine synthase
MLVLGVLMVSNVKYPKMPGFSFRTGGQAAATVFVLACMIASLIKPDAVLFPLGLAYALFGVVRGGLLGLTERHEPEVVAGGDAAGAEITSLSRERRERRKEME